MILSLVSSLESNTTPKPAIRVKSGSKTVKVTAVAPNTVAIPGSTVFESQALGTLKDLEQFTQDTKTVSVRNPPKPKAKN